MRLRWVIVLLMIIFFVSGCWDVTDIEQRSLVIGLGLDAAPDNQVLVSAQIPVPGTSPLVPPSGKTYQTISNIGKTGYGATLGLEKKVTRKLFFGQIQAVVINTALAERGLKPYFEFLERHPEITPQSVVVLTETTAREILSAPLSSKLLPGLAISSFLLSPAKANQVFPIETWQFHKKIVIRPTDAYLPYISYDEEEQTYRFEGIGVFHRDRLAGKLPENESRMAGMMMKESQIATFTVPVGKMGEISYRRVKWTSKISIVKTEPNLEFLIKIKARGFGPEITEDPTELTPNQINAIEGATESYLRKNMMTALRHLQQLNSDIIGFGDLVRAERPEVWRGLNWDEGFPLAGFRVSVKFTLERVGKYR